MYTLEQIEVLIPDTYKAYGLIWSSVNKPVNRTLKEKTYPTIGTYGVDTIPVPCQYCSLPTLNKAGQLFHPLLRLVEEREKSWPRFCNTKCLRHYIVENQVELLLSATA